MEGVHTVNGKNRLDKLNDDGSQKPDPPEVKSIFDFTAPDAKDNLLGNRFLERKGSLLFVAQSGIGKSSASVQQDMEWACGRASFGIKPNGPLKILCIQAEDTDGDIHEFREGVKKRLNLTKDEEELVRKNCLYVTYKEGTGLMFLNEIVEPLLRDNEPDILRLNPLNSYIGASVSDPLEIAKFCRHTLNRLMEQYNCGVIIVHHTPKTTYQDKEAWKTSDWMYACIGSADLTNWARAVLVIAAIKGDDQMFAWIAAKRGRRIGWVDESGNDTCKRHYKHSDNGDISWELVDEIDVPVQTASAINVKKEFNADKMMELLPPYPLDILKGEYIEKVQTELKVGQLKAESWVKIIIDNGAVNVIPKPRPNTRPALYLMRKGDLHAHA